MEKKKKGKKEWKSKKFNIFGDEWRIVFRPKVYDCNGDWIWGQTYGSERRIYISLMSSTDTPLKDNDILDTIAHECVHAILDSGQYAKESDNEPLVEFLGKGILSLIKSKVFEYETSL